MTQKVLITGGGGYVGSQICKDLHDAGFQPFAFDNFSRGHVESVKWGAFHKGDLTDLEAIRMCFDEFCPDVVVHCAGLAYVGESVQKPLPYFETNVGGSANLLRVMIERGVKRIVFSSTCSIYGDDGGSRLLSEATTPAPTNPYAFSKLAVENLLEGLGKAEGLEFVALRFFNVAGADYEGLGEIHDPETHLLPLLVRAALDGGSFNVFGDDYPTPDGSCVRDYIHVRDISSAHLAAIKYLHGGQPSRIFNLGTGNGHSVFEMINAVEKVTGKTINYKVRDRRDGDPAQLIADPSLAKDKLGWQTVHSDLSELVESAVWWHTTGFNGSNTR